jgi:hypothetical protein
VLTTCSTYLPTYFSQDYLHTIDSKISLTIDLWTSSNNKAFVSTTAHFIDNDWTLQEILIDFGVLSGHHDGENIADGVYSVLKEYDLVHKVHAITIDNAHSNNLFVQELSVLLQRDNVEWDWKSQRFRCFNHIMNLAVQNGLGCFKNEIEKVITSLLCSTLCQPREYQTGI